MRHCLNCGIAVNGVNMKKIYVASGFNSWTNKQLTKAFLTEKEADSFLEGLTNPYLQVLTYKSTVDLLNQFLRG